MSCLINRYKPSASQRANQFHCVPLCTQTSLTKQSQTLCRDFIQYICSKIHFKEGRKKINYSNVLFTYYQAREQPNPEIQSETVSENLKYTFNISNSNSAKVLCSLWMACMRINHNYSNITEGLVKARRFFETKLWSRLWESFRAGCTHWVETTCAMCSDQPVDLVLIPLSYWLAAKEK